MNWFEQKSLHYKHKNILKGFNQEVVKSPPTKKVNNEENEPSLIFPSVPDMNLEKNSSNNKMNDSYDDLAKRFENLKKK